MARLVRVPLRLPKRTRADLEAGRARALPRAPLPIAGGSLGLDWGSATLSGASGPTIDVGWGTARLQITCPSALVTHLLSRLDPGLADARPEDDLLGLLIEAAMLPEIAAFEATTGQPLRCLGVATSAPATEGSGLPLVLNEGGRRWPLLLRCENSVLTALLRHWPVAPQPWAALPIPVCFRIGATRLPLAVLRSLGPADVVLLETRLPGAGAIVVGEVAVAPARPEGAAWRLEARPRSPIDTEKDWIMTVEDASPAPDEGSAGLDDIPVRLAFDLGQTAMPLGDLRRLGPGAVIETGRTTDDIVRISANGRLVGHGRLVDVEGRVGVEIVRLFDHE